MQVHFGTDHLCAEWPQAVVCIGTFDGVHLGHQAVITAARSVGRERHQPTILVTFDRHPAAILAPGKEPASLQSLEDNLAAMRSLGVEATVVLPFDAALSRMSADRFLHEILIGHLHAHELVVGHDFAMGNGREGTAEWLARRIATQVVPPFARGDERVSSSGIRNLVQQGRMVEARTHLGRPFRISGIVVQGERLGRTLGFPTANLARSFNQTIPADGIYAARAHTRHGAYSASLYIGYRPTVNGQSLAIEAYLLDYPGADLYGSLIEVDVIDQIRGDMAFRCLDDLRIQMEQDVRETRSRLASVEL